MPGAALIGWAPMALWGLHESGGLQREIDDCRDTEEAFLEVLGRHQLCTPGQYAKVENRE
eukprot:1137964-Pelagomonas_calceolata.AAC.2